MHPYYYYIQQVIEIGVIWKRLCEFEIKYYTTHLLFFDKVFPLISFSSIRSKLLQNYFFWVLSKEHISFFRLSSALSYAGTMKLSTSYTSCNFGNHSIKFRLVCCLVIGWKKWIRSNFLRTGVWWKLYIMVSGCWPNISRFPA